jgi:outer membrane protein assembly factor BamB
MRASHRIVSVLAFMAAACAGLTGCSTTDNTEAVVTPTDLPGLQSVGLHQVWQRQVPLERGERISKIWRVGLSLYVATSECRIARLEARTGILKWGVGLGYENFDIFRPVELKGADGLPSGEVLVVTRGEAFIFNMVTGDEKRRGRLGISVSTDPVVIGNTLCVGGADTFYGMYMDRLGLKRWRIPEAGDLFVSAPLALDNNVLLGSKSGKLCRVSADSGDWDWKDRKTNGDILGGLAADFNALYVPCEDQRVYAFRTDTGGELWEQQLDNRLEEAAVLGGPMVLVRSVDGKLSALAKSSGEIRWSKKGIAAVATVNEETVWIADAAGNIRLVDLESGDEKTSAPAAGIQYFVRNGVDQNVILVTNAGLVGMYSTSAQNVKEPD